MKAQFFPMVLAALCLAAFANPLFGQNALWQTQNNAGWHALEVGNYSEAAKEFDAAVRTAQSFPAPDMRHAMSLAGRAAVYRSQGDLRSAQGLDDQALAIAEKVVGAEDRGVAAILDKLASVYQQRRQYAKAEPLFARALAIREKLLGSDHPLVAASLTSLASCYGDRGQYSKATPLFDRALSVYREKFGDDDPLVAAGLYNLAVVYQKQSNFKEAETYFQRSLAAWENSRITNHEDFAACLLGLAEIHASQDAPAKAEPLLKRTLAIQEAQPGADRATTAKTLYLLAQSCRRQERLPEAEGLFKRSLTTYENAVGGERAGWCEVVESYAAMLNESGRGDEAQKMQTRYASAFLYRAWDRLTAGQGAAGDAAKTFVALKGWSDPTSAAAALVGYFGYRYAGRDVEARELLDEAASNADRNVWPYPVVSYLKQDIPGDRLLALARDNEKMVLVQTFFGLSLSQRGDAAGAMAHLNWVQTHADDNTTLEYRVAVAEIDRIQAPSQSGGTQTAPAVRAGQEGGT